MEIISNANSQDAHQLARANSWSLGGTELVRSRSRLSTPLAATPENNTARSISSGQNYHHDESVDSSRTSKSWIFPSLGSRPSTAQGLGNHTARTNQSKISEKSALQAFIGTAVSMVLHR